ncbi:MAG TPA: ABC transporter ATP-binding protein, partial [Gemmatimonadaceae bacterium]|nr:ABC transporter ATP-binding protein [Gemmatimonadaceae bacterium]
DRRGGRGVGFGGMNAPTLHDEETLGKVYDARLARRLLAYVRPYGGIVAAAVVLLLAESLLQLVGPLLTRRVIDVAFPARDTGLVARSALLFAVALVVQFGCAYGETLLTSLLGQRVMRDLRHELFAHLQRLPVAFFDRNPVGRLVTRVTSDVEALNELFTAGVVAGLGDLFTLVAISVLMLVEDWRLALAAFAVIPLIVYTSRAFRQRVRQSYRDIRTRLARINAFLQERIGGMRIVQLFGRERHERARFDRLNREHLEAHLYSVRIYALYLPVIEIFTSIALASIIVAATGRIATGALTVGTVAAFLQLVRRFFQPLQDLSDKFNTLQQAMAASERIFQLLDTPGVVDEGARGAGARVSDGGPPPKHTIAAPPVSRLTRASRAVPDRPARVEARERGATVEFQDVWFAYDRPHSAGGPAAPAAEPEWVLRGVSFVVRPGETLALVGHTGAGKTTVISLLLRFYEPQRGRILLDGVDVRRLSLRELRERIGYVQQDIFLFAADVAANIRLSAPLSDDAVRRAAARVGADRVVARLPHGYAQELAERGSSLSVGERQLLSFARAIAADPDLLLLDEATSAVDSEAEAEIQAGLAELMRGRTTIAVAHRLSTIVNATEILVLHHGQVRERGTHRALLARGGLYERLYRLQVGVLSGAATAAE